MHISQKILSDITVFMKYAKYLPEKNRRETWTELVDRNKQMHLEKFPTLLDEIESAYKFVYDKKVLPSMRSMQFAGKPIDMNPSRIFNCAYCPIDNFKVFSEIMFLLLGGTGVGFSVQNHHVEQLPEIRKPNPNKFRRFLVSDNIEGWADAINVLMKSYFKGGSSIKFDFSDIRPKGSRLITSGGKAPGPQPLKECILKIQGILDSKNDEEQLSSLEVYDITCHLADAVLAGGIRRAALICLFSADDDAMISCKSGNWWELNPQRGRSNNSAVLLRHKITKEFFFDLWKRIELSNAGEPGIYLTNDQNWGSNPCVEIALRPFQFCNLCEVNATNVESQEDLNERVKAATFIGTLQASYTDFHYLRPIWKKTTEKDALIGISMTGIASNIVTKLNLEEAANQVVTENKRVANLIGINSAARTTCIKPAGCRPWNGLVTTNEGILTLQELFVNHVDHTQWTEYVGKTRVYQDNGVSQRITKTYHNGIDDVYSIKLEGQIELQCTKNHPWFVTKNYNRKKKNRYTEINDFIATENLNPGDIIDIKLGTYTNNIPYKFKNVSMFSIRMRDNTSEIIQPTEMNTDIAWLIGYLWGDGSLSEHKYRIRFTDQNYDNLYKANQIILNNFGLQGNIIKCKNKDAYTLEIGSIQLYHWFSQNGIRKYYNNNIDLIPECIRRSTQEDVIAFIAGLVDSDGSVYKQKNNSFISVVISQKYSIFTRHLQDVAAAVGIHLNHSFNLSGKSFAAKRNMVLMSISSFTLKESVELFAKHSGKYKRMENPDNLPIINNSICKAKQLLGKVISVGYVGEMETYDVEIENQPWFYAGAVKSHNTTSLTLGTSSGIHAWHDEYYIRRIRVGKNEAIYNYLSNFHPELIEDEYFRPHDTAVISIPQKAPLNSITRNENVFDLLERVKRFSTEWIKPGHQNGQNTHNVSATISIKSNEWESVGKWMWENRDYYSGLSVLPYDNGSYIQAPFETINEETYNKLVTTLTDIDLSNVFELEDNTDLQSESACAGGQCEIK